MLYAVNWNVPNTENELANEVMWGVFQQATDDSNEENWHQAVKLSTFFSLLVVFTKPSKAGM